MTLPHVNGVLTSRGKKPTVREGAGIELWYSSSAAVARILCAVSQAPLPTAPLTFSRGLDVLHTQQ